MTRVDPSVVRRRVLERLQSSDVEIDESDLPEFPAPSHRVSGGLPRVPVDIPHKFAPFPTSLGASRASSGQASGTSNGGKRVTHMISGGTVSTQSAAKRSNSTTSKHSTRDSTDLKPSNDGRPTWGANAKSKPATSSSAKDASLSVLKREAAARRTRGQLVSSGDDTEGDVHDENETAVTHKRNPKRGERNASVYNRLLRESRRPARMHGKSQDEKENSFASVPVDGCQVSQASVKVLAHKTATAEDGNGGYWATAEGDHDAGTSANDRDDDDGAEVTSTAKRVWLDTGGIEKNELAYPPVAEDSDAGSVESHACSSPERAGDDEVSFTPLATVAESQRVSRQLRVAQVTLTLRESRQARSEDEASASDEALDDTSDESFSSEVAESMTIGSEDSFASASLEPEDETEHEDYANGDAPTSDSAQRDPNPDDVDVAGTLWEDNNALRAKLREAAQALIKTARERAESLQDRVRLRKDLATRDAEAEKLQREFGLREKTLEKALENIKGKLEKTQGRLEKAESKASVAVDQASAAEKSEKAAEKAAVDSEKRAADFEKRAEDAEKRAKASETLANDAEDRARTATRARESAKCDAERVAMQTDMLQQDLILVNEALTQMTEACEDARASTKAARVWRVARGESADTARPNRAVSDDSAAAEAAARALAAAVAEAEAILVAGPEGADVLNLKTPSKDGVATGDDFGAARSLVSAARRTCVDAKLRLEELHSLRLALTGEMAAARRAETETAALRSRTHSAEAEAHTAWCLLDVASSQIASGETGKTPVGRKTETANTSTPKPVGNDGHAFNLLSLVSPSLAYSPARVLVETEAAALDKVVAHLNKRRGRGAAGFTSAIDVGADDRRVAFFCFRFWKQLTAMSHRKSPMATPAAVALRMEDEFAFDVASAGAATEHCPLEHLSPPHRPLPLPRWAPPQEATQAHVSPSLIDFNTPPLERWARRA